MVFTQQQGGQCVNKKLCSGMIILWVFLLSSIGLKVNVSVEETHYFNH